MTEAGWTSEKPTKNGWYWWRRPLVAPTLALVFGPPQGVLMYLPEDETSEAAISVSATYEDTEWLGPLSPTDRQQGRVEAYTNVLKECEQEASQAFRGGDYQLACRYIAEHCCEQLAQQAQDEKEVGDVHK